MLTHDTIWQAIDLLAQNSGYSTSGLAKKAGLDPTSFNRSKRVGADGKPRWPSTESISLILKATNSTMPEFVALISTPQLSQRLPSRIPLLALHEATQDDRFDKKGHPVNEKWDMIDFPLGLDAGNIVFALEISSPEFLPFFREGDRLVVSPSAPVRKGDRVVVRTQDGHILIKEMNRQTASRIELKSFMQDDDIAFAPKDVEWIARIVWISQ